MRENPKVFFQKATVQATRRRVVAQFEFLMESFPVVGGVILRVAVLQAKRRISRYGAVCHGRSLGPLVKTRALRDDAS
jgi:hypothetical protein